MAITDIALAAMLIVAGVAKLQAVFEGDAAAFQDTSAVRWFGYLGTNAPIAGGVSLAEVGVGAALLVPASRVSAFGLARFLVGAFCVYHLMAFLVGTPPPSCGCLGLFQASHAVMAMAAGGMAVYVALRFDALATDESTRDTLAGGDS